jgi:hypothetical protein
MTPERWKEVEKVFNATLDREPEARGAFLDENAMEQNQPETGHVDPIVSELHTFDEGVILGIKIWDCVNHNRCQRGYNSANSSKPEEAL